ncbi:MAG: aldo/keto reductase [Hyphomicrobiales bacterium]|nr:aldo/keto reductase [Hyphomicrobiales bacterium]
MEYRELGHTGVKVSAICLGTMTWGEQNTEAEGHAQMDFALDRGVNFLDTAELYAIPPKPETRGATERIIGTWFKARQNRDKIILASKVAGRSGMGWLRQNGRKTELSGQQIREAVHGSLKNLQTDYIDLYQVHWPDRPASLFGRNGTVYEHATGPEIAIEDTLHALSDLVKEGKIRFIGLSNETAWGTMHYLHLSKTNGFARVHAIQNAYNLVNRTFEMGLAEIAHRERVGLLAYSPLAQGYLSGKYRSGALPPKSRKALFQRMQRYETPGAAEAIESYLALADERGIDPSHLAIRFVTSRPFVTSAIIGATAIEQLETDIDAASLAWTDDLEDAVNALHQLYQNRCP